MSSQIYSTLVHQRRPCGYKRPVSNLNLKKIKEDHLQGEKNAGRIKVRAACRSSLFTTAATFTCRGHQSSQLSHEYIMPMNEMSLI